MNVADVKKISIVIPVYNSTASLSEIVRRVSLIFETTSVDYEIIFVDDGSESATWHVMRKLKNFNQKVKLIQLSKNFGQHSALLCGLSFAVGDYAITMDDDLQNPPEMIPRMLEAIVEGGDDVVFGVPAVKRQSFFRRVGSFFFLGLGFMNFGGKESKVSNFRILNRSVIGQLAQINASSPLISRMIFDITHKIGYIEVDHESRAYGESGYNLGKLVKHAWNVLTSSLYFPVFISCMATFSVGIFLLIIYTLFFCSSISLLTVFFLLSILGIVLLFSILFLMICLLKFIEIKMVDVLRKKPYYIKEKII